MRSGKGGKDQFSSIGVSRVNGEPGTLGHGIGDGEDVGKVELWGDSLRVEVEGEGDEVDVSSTFTVSENGPFDSVSSGENTEFGSSDGASYVTSRGDVLVSPSSVLRLVVADKRLTSIVMGMQTDDALFSLSDVGTEVLYLIGETVWRGNLYRGGQVLTKDPHRRLSRQPRPA